MDLSQHFRTIWRRKWYVLIASLVVAGLVFAWRESVPRTYRATAVLSVTPAQANGQSITKDDATFLAESYAALAQTGPLAGKAASEAGLPWSATEATGHVSVNTSSVAGYINLSGTASSAAQAEAFAGRLAVDLQAAVSDQQAKQKAALIDPITTQINSFQDQINALPTGSPQRQLLNDNLNQLILARAQALTRPVDIVSLIAPARADAAPLSPRPLRDTVLALIIAVILNAEGAAAFEAVSDRFNISDDGTDDVASVTGLPVLARVPRVHEDHTLEEIRTLRTNLMFASTSKSLRSVAVVGVEPGSGKSFISRQLAFSVASLDIPVLLIDGDLRRPALHQEMRVNRVPGLSDVLQGLPMQDAVSSSVDLQTLNFLAAGSPVADPAGLLGGPSLRSASQQLTWVELVVVDTPASTFFADALAIASQCDATLIVINARRSRRRSVRALIQQLRQVDANPVGVVVNWAGSSSRSSQYYYVRRRPGRVHARGPTPAARPVDGAGHREPAHPRPAHPRPARTEPARTEPARTEPARTEPARTEPGNRRPAVEGRHRGDGDGAGGGVAAGGTGSALSDPASTPRPHLS